MQSELSFLKLTILAKLREHKATNRTVALTINELSEEIEAGRSALYKNIISMFMQGYVAKGLKVVNAYSFYITDKGLNLQELKDFSEE